MATPAFVPQNSASMTPIRYYTPFDPYFYTVDNRPLQDIAANLESLGSKGGDSARRAVLLNQLSVSSAFSSLFPIEGGTGFVDGMSVTLNGTSLQIGPGALYLTDAVSTEVATSVVKQAVSLKTTSFGLTAPNAGLGDAKDYLVQVKFSNLDQGNMATSQLPFLDSTNSMLPGLLLNGEATLSIKEGVTASLGSQVTPTADAGALPLYVVTYCTVASNNRVRLHSSAPNVKRGKVGVPLYSGNTLAGTGNSSLSLPISIATAGFSPYLPIKLRVLYSVSTPNNNAALVVKYLSLVTGASTTAATTSAGQETVVMPATANVLAEFVTSTAVIPTHAFAGYVNNTWQINRSALRVTLDRLGDDAADTTNGVITVLEVQAFQ